MALPAALSQLELDVAMLVTHFRDFAAGKPAVDDANQYSLPDECLLEGLLSRAWQAWNLFCRACVIDSCLGAVDANGATIVGLPAAASEAIVSGAACLARYAKPHPSYWVGTANNTLRSEPTWGDTDILARLLTRLQPTNSSKMLAAFSSAHPRAKALQLIRNGAAHNHQENLADILALRSAYTAFRISHPTQALFWLDPNTNDFLVTQALSDLTVAALTAIS